MLNSPLTQLRKCAPRSLTVNDLVDRFARYGLPRSDAAIGAFERGFVEEPDEQFFKAYARAIGCTVSIVKGAHVRTKTWKIRLDEARAAEKRRIRRAKPRVQKTS